MAKKIIISPEYEHLREFLTALPEIFDSSGTVLYEGRNVVKSITVDGVELIVKRYRRPHVVQCLSYSYFTTSKAERAYNYARRLRESGFSTPREVAYIEMKSNTLLTYSFFVSLPDYRPPLSQLLRRPDFSRVCVDQLARFVASLHENGVIYGDLNLTNILYSVDDQEQYQFALIDTNRARFDYPSRRQAVDDFIRLSYEHDFLNYFAGRYAECRGWKPERTQSEAIDALARFERRHSRYDAIKRALGLKKKDK
ncbi:MAG: lipopolysaccharide kinase InaA family protein [Candidatus Limisoma sp.]